MNEIAFVWICGVFCCYKSSYADRVDLASALLHIFILLCRYKFLARKNDCGGRSGRTLRPGRKSCPLLTIYLKGFSIFPIVLPFALYKTTRESEEKSNFLNSFQTRQKTTTKWIVLKTTKMEISLFYIINDAEASRLLRFTLKVMNGVILYFEGWKL